MFQLREAARSRVISYATLRGWLIELANDAGLRDHDGQPLAFTAHDFRRLFITDIVNAGFPIHLAAKLVGHKNIEVTRGSTRGRLPAGRVRGIRQVHRAAAPAAPAQRVPGTDPSRNGLSSSSTSGNARSRWATAGVLTVLIAFTNTLAYVAISSRSNRVKPNACTTSGPISSLRSRRRRPTSGSATSHSSGSPSNTPIARQLNSKSHDDRRQRHRCFRAAVD